MAPQIHPQLLADCHLIGRWPRCHLLLNRNALLPWFILVPETEQADLLDLDAEQRNEVMGQAALVAAFVKERWQLTKTNFGALGNVVPQMHLHVIGRSVDDACWPKPVWGNLGSSQEYAAQSVREIRQALAARDPAFQPALEE
ncbi:HIT domain-containing protein [Planctomicrobium sp. SH664]|uniref:HIT domain-containing protein n=1 Tax=Planctomicrobium sp. SH664 TaxID=3448125 RepID=UPI003F5B464B